MISKKCTKRCAVCADFFFVFDVFVAVVVAAAPYFYQKGHSVMTYGKIQNVFVYGGIT